MTLNPFRDAGAVRHGHDPNAAIYDRADVVAYYALLADLTPAERFVFGSWLSPGMRILDLGVGGGRTTPWLASGAARYVGLDASERMIEGCRCRFPGREFVRGDAADLGRFDDDSFDAIVFAFNGLDYLYPADRRARCLAECARVLAPGGVFIGSAHNADAVLVPPVINPERVAALARRLAPPDSAAYRLAWMAVLVLKLARVGVDAARRTLTRAVTRLPTTLFWRGHGYFVDPAHGGLLTHAATRAHVEGEMRRAGFELLTVVGDGHPRTRTRFATEWYYYAFRKRVERAAA